MGCLRLIKDSIDKLLYEYNKDPNNFFNEHDFQHCFFYIAHSIFDDKSISLLHPEYPTRKRFIREKSEDDKYSIGKHSFPLDKKLGRRGHYDFVVLNSKFYNDYHINNLEKLSNKTVMINKDINYKYIDIAIEFKFITKNLNINEIEFDLFKLNEAEEVKAKLLIVFIRKGIPHFDEFYNKIQNLEKGKVEVQILTSKTGSMRR